MDSNATKYIGFAYGEWMQIERMIGQLNGKPGQAVAPLEAKKLFVRLLENELKLRG